MNSSHCSRTCAILLAVALVFTLAAPVAAVTTDADDVPDSEAVGAEVSVTYTLTDLYDDHRTWTLNGTTELENVSWSVRTYDSAGDQVGQTESYDGSSFAQGVSADDGVARVEVRVSGTVPAIEEFTYEPAEQFELTSFAQEREGGGTSEIDSWHVHHYTADSNEARQAIDRAGAAIDDASDAGADVAGAERTYNNAISAYESADFENAIDLADQAEERAIDEKQSTERNRLVMYGGVGVVVLALLVGGGYFLYQSRQDSYDKLG